MQSLTVLGSGTILPVPGHGCSGYAVATDKGLVLLDCGPGVLYRLAEARLPVTEITAILVSHYHLDHISDLGAILLSLWLKTLQGGNRRVTIAGPAGLARVVGRAREQAKELDELDLDLVELAADGIARPLGDTRLDLAALHTGHTDASLCYRLSDEGGKVLFYSGDTDYNEALLPIAQDADLAVIECSMPENRKLKGHLTPGLAGRFASKARVRRLLLTHLYPEVLDVPVVALAREEFDGPIELASDLGVHRFDRL